MDMTINDLVIDFLSLVVSVLCVVVLASILIRGYIWMAEACERPDRWGKIARKAVWIGVWSLIACTVILFTFTVHGWLIAHQGGLPR